MEETITDTLEEKDSEKRENDEALEMYRYICNYFQSKFNSHISLSYITQLDGRYIGMHVHKEFNFKLYMERIYMDTTVYKTMHSSIPHRIEMRSSSFFLIMVKHFELTIGLMLYSWKEMNCRNMEKKIINNNELSVLKASVHLPPQFPKTFVFV